VAQAVTTGRVTARLVRRSDRKQVLAYLALDPLGNLLLLDQVARLGSSPAPGEMRSEVAVARRGEAIVGVVGLRPTVVFDTAVASEAIEAFLPFVESLGVGLVKSPIEVVDRLWGQLARRAQRRSIVDRCETAYVLRAPYARLRDPAGRAAARPATHADLGALVIAARESLREEGRPDPFSGDAPNFRRWVGGRVARARVIESEGRVVFVAYADVQRPEGWLVQGVYTWPELRGRGLATAGVSDLCQEAFAAGADHVQLAVVEGNVPGVRLYERLGFKPFARLRTILFSEG
jgi:RimJ/RimL family protein N-acetyltransferase